MSDSVKIALFVSFIVVLSGRKWAGLVSQLTGEFLLMRGSFVGYFKLFAQSYLTCLSVCPSWRSVQLDFYLQITARRSRFVAWWNIRQNNNISGKLPTTRCIVSLHFKPEKADFIFHCAKTTGLNNVWRKSACLTEQWILSFWLQPTVFSSQ